MWTRPKEVFHYRSMLYSLVLSELRTRYKGSVLGFLWTFVNPLLMLLVYTLIFSQIMKVNMQHYAVYMFIGLLAWNMFASGVQPATSIIVRQGSLINKIYFPREILPLSVVGGSVVNFLLSLTILFPVLMLNGYLPNWLWLYIPLITLTATAFSCGVSLLLAAINVYLRDLEHMMTIFLMIWFYMTPVIYSLDMIPKNVVKWFKYNPVSTMIMAFQSIFYFHRSIDWMFFWYGIPMSILALVFGWLIFNRLSKRFAEEV